jgi:hypothetical protein
MMEAHTACGPRGHPAPGPPLAEMFAVNCEFAHQLVRPGVVGMPANIHAQGSDRFGRGRRPVTEELLCERIEDDPPGQVPFRRQGGEVRKHEESQAVSGQHVGAAAQDQSGHITHRAISSRRSPGTRRAPEVDAIPAFSGVSRDRMAFRNFPNSVL